MNGIGNIGNKGTMSMSDMSAMREKMFSKLDDDGDGLLSKSEMKAAMEKRKTESNGSPRIEDGKEPNLDEMFSELDSDGDGMLSMTEMEQMQPPPGPPPGGRRSEDGLSAVTMNAQSFALDFLEQKATEQYAVDTAGNDALFGSTNNSDDGNHYL